MSKATKKHRDADGRADYKDTLRTLQIELVKIQKHVIKHGHKVLVIFEGRDASGGMTRSSSGRLALSTKSL